MMAMDRQEQLRGEMLADEPMGRHVSWRAGGSADCFYRPADMADLAAFMRQLDVSEPLLWIGLGSNLLVRDGGFRGTVIAAHGRLNEMQLNKLVLRVEAGVSCAKVARFCAREGLAGLEFLAGIPGAIGGALAMNAGAFGGETWDHLVAVEMMNRQGEIVTRKAEEFEVSYRHVAIPEGEWFVAGHFELTQDPEGIGQARIRELLRERNEKQPIGVYSCGSVFKNPEGDYAARLIESCGLKGYCIGGACVSDKHANFIINRDEASAADIEQLISHVQETVHEQQGVKLETEVRIVGEHV